MDMAASKDLPTCSIMSRKRYNAIEAHVRSIVSHEAADSIMANICETMRFDPEVGMVTPRRAENMKKRLQRIAEERGVSIYVAKGEKDRYERIKALKGSAQVSGYRQSDGVDINRTCSSGD